MANRGADWEWARLNASLPAFLLLHLFKVFAAIFEWPKIKWSPTNCVLSALIAPPKNTKINKSAKKVFWARGVKGRFHTKWRIYIRRFHLWKIKWSKSQIIFLSKDKVKGVNLSGLFTTLFFLMGSFKSTKTTKNQNTTAYD